MKKIFVVFGGHGQYEDREERMVRAFLSKEKAEKFMDLCQEQMGALSQKARATCCKKQEAADLFCALCGKKLVKIDFHKVTEDPTAYGLTADPSPHFTFGHNISYYVGEVDLDLEQ